MVRLIGIVPLGIGLTTITFAWSNEFGGFGQVPIFFRLFTSFIALGFILIGGTILFAGGGLMPPQQLIDKALDLRQQMEAGMRERGMTPPGEQKQAPPMTSEGYVCPSCNAPIGTNADVSPHGDVKCGHCGRWFNVHGR
ncbi:hypothetical protein AYO47_08750 [Planctomyces sp. SCGC AG-212-M04]|nr:hypothetical protein AYO47_08750 [Planctomyces sp. SCGC AG-212-M04]